MCLSVPFSWARRFSVLPPHCEKEDENVASVPQSKTNMWNRTGGGNGAAKVTYSPKKKEKGEES
jgi:hypothetical protein